MGSEGKPVVGQIEDHFAAGRYQPCRWSGSSWIPVNAAPVRKPATRSVSSPCHYCGTYCYGDCRS